MLYEVITVIMLTAYGEVEKAVAAMRDGAFNYLTKPFKNDELIANIKKAVEHYSLLRENIRLRHEVKKRSSFAEMIGVITSYSIHYTKLYEPGAIRSGSSSRSCP